MRQLLTLTLLVVAFLVGGCPRKPDTPPSVKRIPWDGGTKILIGGDFGYADTYNMSKRALRPLGLDHPMEKLEPFFSAADYTVLNLETPVTDVDIKPYRELREYVHRGIPSRYKKRLTMYGVDAVSLANNHTMDCGAEGLGDTLVFLEGLGIESFGAGKNSDEANKPLEISFDVEGVRHELAMFGFMKYRRVLDNAKTFSIYAAADREGASSLRDATKVLRDYRQRHPEKFVIAYPHWGWNYKWRRPDQAKRGQALIEAGADVVIGHGAHLVQEIERHEGKWIINSLGNLLFTTPGRYQKLDVWPYSMIAVLRLGATDGKPSRRVRLYPVFGDNLASNYQPYPVDKAGFEDLQQLFRKRSREAVGLETFLSEAITGRDDLGFFFEIALD